MPNTSSKSKQILKSFNKKILKKRYGILLIPLILILIIFYIFILKDLPSPTRLSSSNIPQSTQIFDRKGELLFTIYGQKNQTFIPLSTVPKHIQQATIATEDRDFYQHGPIDIKGIARSVVAITLRNQIQGGSTITQQLVKNSLL